MAWVATTSFVGNAQPVGGLEAQDHTLRGVQILPGTGARFTSITPKYQYLFGPTARWMGPLRWRYNHTGAPPPLTGDKAGVIAQLQKSFDQWTSQCAVTYSYDGETTTSPNKIVNDPENGPLPDGVSVVGWGPLDATFGGWTYAWYAQEGNKREIFDADITLSSTNINSLPELNRLVTHEWGHALGLDHSNTESAIMAGPPATYYNALAVPQPDDVRGCRCLYGLPPGMSAPYACAVPPKVDFGNAAVGEPSSAQSVTFMNSGNAPLEIQWLEFTDAQFQHVDGCGSGTVVLPGASCSLGMQVTPDATGEISARIALFTNDGFYELSLAAIGVAQGQGVPVAAAPTIEVIEYYNTTLDHYFITWTAAEIANLDAGSTPTRWVRTGLTFRAHATPQPGTSQICRFYIPPSEGDSHFFGRNQAECSASQQANPKFVLEDPDYMQLYMPIAGACPARTRPVYRLFSNRPDANHRYLTERAIRDQMVAAGWLAEGDGPDVVAMCAPV